MSLTKQIADDLRKVYNGGNWTAVSLKDALDGLSWMEATKQIYKLNTIATLVFHNNYYINANIKVLEGGALEAKDSLSFAHPPIDSQEDWQRFIAEILDEVEKFASLIEEMQEEKLWQPFTDASYGTYYRNFQGIIEHCHYHIGQIMLIKKIIKSSAI